MSFTGEDREPGRPTAFPRSWGLGAVEPGWGPRWLPPLGTLSRQRPSVLSCALSHLFSAGACVMRGLLDSFALGVGNSMAQAKYPTGVNF